MALLLYVYYTVYIYMDACDYNLSRSRTPTNT